MLAVVSVAVLSKAVELGGDNGTPQGLWGAPLPLPKTELGLPLPSSLPPLSLLSPSLLPARPNKTRG